MFAFSVTFKKLCILSFTYFFLTDVYDTYSVCFLSDVCNVGLDQIYTLHVTYFCLMDVNDIYSVWFLCNVCSVGLERMYALSFTSYSLAGLLVTVIVSTIVSAITGQYLFI